MAFSLSFKSFEHAIAKVAKYTAVGLGDLIGYANKAQAIEPEVLALVSAVAGPAASGLADLGFNVLGEVAGALKNVQVDASTATTSVSLSLATQTASDVKAAIAQIEAIIKALGGPGLYPTQPIGPAPAVHM